MATGFLERVLNNQTRLMFTAVLSPIPMNRLSPASQAKLLPCKVKVPKTLKLESKTCTVAENGP